MLRNATNTDVLLHFRLCLSVRCHLFRNRIAKCKAATCHQLPQPQSPNELMPAPPPPRKLMCHLHKDAFLSSIAALRGRLCGWQRPQHGLSFWAVTQQRRSWAGATGGASEFVPEATPSSSAAEYSQAPYLATWEAKGSLSQSASSVLSPRTTP